MGRQAELDRCTAAFHHVRNREPRTLFIVGEPGIGKTRLAAEVAAHLHESGATVLCGRCDPELGVPYQPFVEILTHFARFAPQELLAQHRAQYGRELARLVPELGGFAAPQASAGQSRSDNRHVMFAAVAGLLHTAAVQRPLVLMLDDLHWADGPTLLMLKYLLVYPQMPALVVGTYRSTEVLRGSPLWELLSELQRQPGVDRVELTGLELDECVTMAQDRRQRDARPRPASSSCRRSARPPAAIRSSSARSSAASRRPAASPQRWSAATRPTARRSRSRPACATRSPGACTSMGERSEQVLCAAAVIGREFDVELLARMLGSNEEQLIDVLDAGRRGRADRRGARDRDALQLRAPADPARRCTSSWAAAAAGGCTAARSTGSSSCSATRRAASGAASSPTTRSPGVPIVTASRAVHYAREAGEHALDQLAPQEATRWFEHALALHESASSELEDGDGDALLCDLLIGHGIAEQQSGDASVPRDAAGGLRARRADEGHWAAGARGAGEHPRVRRARPGSSTPSGWRCSRPRWRRSEIMTAPSAARLLATLSSELTYSRRLGAAQGAQRRQRRDRDAPRRPRYARQGPRRALHHDLDAGDARRTDRRHRPRAGDRRGASRPARRVLGAALEGRRRRRGRQPRPRRRARRPRVRAGGALAPADLELAGRLRPGHPGADARAARRVRALGRGRLADRVGERTARGARVLRRTADQHPLRAGPAARARAADRPAGRGQPRDPGIPRRADAGSLGGGDARRGARGAGRRLRHRVLRDRL